jgi:hypothetical protein
MSVSSLPPASRTSACDRLHLHLVQCISLSLALAFTSITAAVLVVTLCRNRRLPREAALPFPNPFRQILRQIHSFELALCERRRASFTSQAGAIGSDFDLRALDEAEHGLEVAGHVRDCALGGLGGFCVAVQQGVFLAFAPSSAALSGSVTVAVDGAGDGGGRRDIGCGGGVALGVAIGKRYLVAAARVACVGALFAVWTCDAVAGGCGSFAAVFGVLVVAEALDLAACAFLV